LAIITDPGAFERDITEMGCEQNSNIEIFHSLAHSYSFPAANAAMPRLDL